MAPRILTSTEAAQLVPDGATIALCGCLSLLEPDAILEGIEARFLRDGHPRDLTVIHPVMLASRKGTGINRFAHDGLMRRVIGGSFSIFPDYEITGMITEERVEAYNLPIGTIMHWLRESGAGRPAQLRCSSQCLVKISFNFPIIYGIACQSNATREEVIACLAFEIGRTYPFL